ncbi:Crp/Fnr family transcriptional regulator [Chitinophaga arvensicola]|uniref:cAMP-binding domain of CRP or a regulatory subunit of cAMP-dependent protein kinases n=1 Tax=Chitinophaga arvensicola TaxID=29529 RepID=A0A1I0SDX1_9BACT|nr:Crp/Fnr family transcriptional regulator [Chitinophaga arvensicola]SEW54286.1 cAMP-binding domain of CRP or a regulatory subunit of cAMP-dependent protein kinases [Chitinophaga arvensicola]
MTTPSPINWPKYQHLYEEISVPAKTVLLEEGKTSRYAYYIVEGAVRLWFNNKGKDTTFQFFFEGEGVSSIESFRTGQPSMCTIETISAARLLKVSKENLDLIIDSEPGFRANLEGIIFHRLLRYTKMFIAQIRDTPQERYEALIRDQPHILQRVPLQYIASYLGITPVSLSRIRNKLQREK